MRFRFSVILGFFLLALLVVIFRVASLQIFNTEFLQDQGDARTLRKVTLPAHRGMILDRNSEPLAISAPVASIWVNPSKINLTNKNLSKVFNLLNISEADNLAKIKQHSKKSFIYLKRHIEPDLAEKIDKLNIAGLHLKREYRRFYPEGEITAHVVGFTNIDDQGQEGLELGYQDYLAGTPGRKTILKDRIGREIDTLKVIAPSKPGHDLQLSLDRRLQYLAYRELTEAVNLHQAKAGSVVILDVQTGEVLAMVNYPSFNPNLRKRAHVAAYRNRAVTDTFEPGSVIKAFSIAKLLEDGDINEQTKVNTSPGWLKIGENIVKDGRNWGTLDIAGILQHSSNVGLSKLLLSVPNNNLTDWYRLIGFGSSTDSGFPGEGSGLLVEPKQGQDFVLATLAFGYGVSVTPLQIAQAYAIIGAKGLKKPVTFLKQAKKVPGIRVFRQEVAQKVLKLLESVVERGSGKFAKISHYRIAGKTGTARKLSDNGGYSSKNHISLFAGIAPVDEPRLAMVVMVDDPKRGAYYGSRLAAPVFADIMEGALRILNIVPQDLPPLKLAQKN